LKLEGLIDMLWDTRVNFDIVTVNIGNGYRDLNTITTLGGGRELTEVWVLINEVVAAEKAENTVVKFHDQIAIELVWRFFPDYLEIKLGVELLNFVKVRDT